MQRTTAVGCCHVRLAPTNSCLVKWPIEPEVGYPVGLVTKKVVLLPTELTIWGRCLFSFRLALCYCPPSCSKLGAILKSSNVVWNSVLTTKLWLTCWSSAARQCQASFWVHYSFLWWGGEHCKFLEVDESCFSRWKCNCSKLCATPWVFFGIERESGTPALHLLLIAPPTHCSPSLRCVSYLAPQMSVVAGRTTFVSAMRDSHTKPLNSPLVLWRTDAHTHMIKTTWKHVKLHLRPYWENEGPCVINRLQRSVSSGFDDVPELIVKCCF
jgi:hypothetical protein